LTAGVLSMATTLLKIGAVAERMDANHKTVRDWIKKGYLSSVRIGRSIRVNADDLETMIAQGRRKMSNAEVLR